MISKQRRAVLITNRSGYIYDHFTKYCVLKNFKHYDVLGRTCVYKDDIYMFSANLYYSYYVVLYLIDENF